MYGGEETKVTIEAKNTMIGVLIGRFGKDIFVIPSGENHFRTVVNVAVSNQFLGWIMALENGIKIISPDSVVEQMKAEIKRLTEQYEVNAL